jgi:hypothetical protein
MNTTYDESRLFGGGRQDASSGDHFDFPSYRRLDKSFRPQRSGPSRHRWPGYQDPTNESVAILVTDEREIFLVRPFQEFPGRRGVFEETTKAIEALANAGRSNVLVVYAPPNRPLGEFDQWFYAFIGCVDNAVNVNSSACTRNDAARRYTPVDRQNGDRSGDWCHIEGWAKSLPASSDSISISICRAAPDRC